jgi:hypothetical protein
LGEIYWGGEPEDKYELIVSCEEEIEKLHQEPMKFLTDVFPAIIFSFGFEASFSEEVIL